MSLNFRKPLLMGILNLTEDSFYDGGKYLETIAIEKKIKDIIDEGADIIDIGAQSTFIDRKEISEKEEVKRILRAINLVKRAENRELRKTMISVDTYRASVAEEVIKNGADIINDVTGLRYDPDMAKIIAKHQVPIVIMYAKESNGRTTIDCIDYEDIILTLKVFFEERIDFAISQGIKKEQIIIDPGMGFFISGKSKYSFQILDRLKELKQYFDLPVLVGTSRKSFLSLDGKLSPKERLEGTLATSAIALYNGANIIRAHDIKEVKKIIDTMENFNFPK